MTEEKVKFLMRIDSDTDRKIKTAMPLANVRSQNEFVENALRFYCDYLASQDCFSVLPPMLVSAIRATVQSSETHMPRSGLRSTALRWWTPRSGSSTSRRLTSRAFTTV